MGSLLQITMSWLCALSRQGAGAIGAGAKVLVLAVVLVLGAVRVVETGAVAGCWLRAWWREGASAGWCCWLWCWCWVL